MGAAEVIAFEEVRARKQWNSLRHQLHERLDQGLDSLAPQWHELPSTFTEVTTTLWDLRQQLPWGHYRDERGAWAAWCTRSHAGPLSQM